MKRSRSGTMVNNIVFKSTDLEENMQKRDGLLVVHTRLIMYSYNDIVLYVLVDHVRKSYMFLNNNRHEQFKFGGPKTVKILELMLSIAKSLDDLLNFGLTNVRISG